MLCVHAHIFVDVIRQAIIVLGLVLFIFFFLHLHSFAPQEFVHIYRASSQPVAMTTAGSNTGMFIHTCAYMYIHGEREGGRGGGEEREGEKERDNCYLPPLQISW